MGGSPVIRSVGVLSMMAVIAAGGSGCGGRNVDGWTAYAIADDGCPVYIESGRGMPRIWAAGPDEAWVASCGKVFRLQEGELREDKGFAAVYASLSVKPQPIIAGTGPTDIWVDAALHFDGSTWKADPRWPHRSGADGRWSSDIWGADPQRYFVAGSGMLAYDGKWTFSEKPGGAAVHGSAADDIYATDHSSIFHFDGERWLLQTDLAVSDSHISLRKLFVRSRDQVWAVGAASASGLETPAVWKREAGGWARVPPPNTPQLWRVTVCGGTVFVASHDKVFGRERDGGWNEVFVSPIDFVTPGITDLFCAGDALMVMVERIESKLWIWR